MSPTARPATRRGTERELKFTVPTDLALPDLRDVVGGTFRRPEQDLDAAYFDTADFRLWARSTTLRHRRGEGPDEGVWTLKVPAAAPGDALARTELSWTGPGDDVPSEAARLTRGVVRRAELRQVTELHTVRRPFELRDDDGRPWAVLDDDLVTVSGGPRHGLRFRQVEIELTDADPPGLHPEADRLLHRVVEALLGAGARRDDIPKLAVALGLSRRGAAREVDLDRDSTLDDVVRASLTAGLTLLLDHEFRLRADPEDPPPHDVHQARVAIRRLRSDLKTFRPVLDPVWTRHTRDDLRRIGTALGALRDLDVLAPRLGQPTDTLPVDAAGRRELLGRLGEQRRRAAHQLVEVLDEDEGYLAVLDRLHAATERVPFRLGPGQPPSRRHPGPDTRARDVLPRLVGRSWRSLRKQVRRAGPAPNDHDLHRIRIGAKQLRYACETAAPVLGPPAHRSAEAAKALQTVLGDHHDTVAAEEWLWHEALEVSPQGSFAAGQLTVVERRHRRELAGRWHRDWRRLRAKKRRRWLIS